MIFRNSMCALFVAVLSCGHVHEARAYGPSESDLQIFFGGLIGTSVVAGVVTGVVLVKLYQKVQKERAKRLDAARAKKASCAGVGCQTR